MKIDWVNDKLDEVIEILQFAQLRYEELHDLAYEQHKAGKNYDRIETLIQSANLLNLHAKEAEDIVLKVNAHIERDLDD